MIVHRYSPRPAWAQGIAERTIPFTVTSSSCCSPYYLRGLFPPPRFHNNQN